MKDTILKDLMRQMADHSAAVQMWQTSEKPFYPAWAIPSDRELVSFLMRRLKRSKICLKAAVTHATKTRTGIWHQVPKGVIELWKKESR